jgi:transposase-like protein
MSQINFAEFQERYSTDAACLEAIVTLRFPDGIYCNSCADFTPHFKLKKRKAYQCGKCLHQFYPLAGTIFQKSRTPLRLWFFALFIITTTRSGVSAKALQRMIKVTYKTAWSMFMKIRRIMSEELGFLKGVVEVDETWIGGKDWYKGKKWWSDYRPTKKQIVFGMVERKGRVKTLIIPDVYAITLLKHIKVNIDPAASIMSDSHFGYHSLSKLGYTHNMVNHTNEYVSRKNPDVHTQTIEGFWGQMKRGITGVYRHVSKKYLQNYCDEYAFRYNYRNYAYSSFDYLFNLIVKV